MCKDELVKALVRAARAKAAASKRDGARRNADGSGLSRRGSKVSASSPDRGSAQTAGQRPVKKTAQPKSPRVASRIRKANAQRQRHKNLAASMDPAKRSANGNARENRGEAPRRKGTKDRVVLLVRDAYWLQVWWDLTRPSVERARAAMAEQWHTAKPVLRLIAVEGGSTTSAVERVVREIDIHGAVKTWYIDVHDSPRSFRVDIGYLAANGRFFTLARSNCVTTPRPSNGDVADDVNWSDIADDCEKIYALSGGYADEAANGELQELFEERLGRPMGSQAAARFGMGAERMLNRQRDFQFEVDAEMIVHGSTKPNARVTLAGTPVKLRPDGTFSARLSMPDRRQVLPVVASSPDGVEQRTIVLAIERNTKVMEPMIREANE